MPEDRITRGKLAKRTGVNLETIRFYEQKELLPEPDRSPANYRLYSVDAVDRVRFIKKAQQLGFTLREIKELLSLRASRGARCGDVLQRAKTKMGEIDEKIRTLQAIQRALKGLMAQCRGKSPITDCPILTALDDSR